jgi:hypothetical protein
MMEWPGRCSRCGNAIEEWADAGLHNKRWIHKSCYSEAFVEAKARGVELPALRTPVERSSQLELPMLFFLLLFHFGLGFAVMGWIMLSQFSDNSGIWLLIPGIVTPLIGLAGVAVNIVSRRRIELVRQELDLQGGWRPGR